MKTKVLAFVLVLIFIAVMCVAECSKCSKTCDAQKPAKNAKMRVLFEVGGYQFHDPVELPKMLKKVLEDTGMYTVNITEDRDQFKAENIKNYDIVLDYTTGGELSKEQEQGLTQFVADGKGFVGIHSATDSFKNSDAYWKMVGGRFTGHGSGKFEVKVTGKSHPIVKGMSDFQIQDETYVDAFHPDAKVIVLMRRPMDSEPASWIQYYGKGRVFVTGLGHGKEAWENLSFQTMIKRAMMWSCGKMNP